MLRLYVMLCCLFIGVGLSAQSPDQALISSLYGEALRAGQSYTMLEHLATRIGPRLSGSEGAEKAVAWSAEILKDFCDTVWLQPVMVPHWVRGRQERAEVIPSKGKERLSLNICALGGSVGTGPSGVRGNVTEVKTFEELNKLGQQAIQGRIVFFNRPFDQTKINTFSAYGGAVDQRASGPSEAARLGAIAVIVRSMGSGIEDYPHTGSLRYRPNVAQIPAVAVSTKHADELSNFLLHDPSLTLYIETHCQTLADVQSYNVIGEIRGKEFPDRVIVVSGHLDSWDLGQGAHDDGAGCVQAIEVLRLFRSIGYAPRHTIRAVMYMNEENGLRGGLEYAKQAGLKNEKHVAAMESDRGGFTPRGFTMTAPELVKAKVRNWKPLLAPFGLTDFDQEGGGADIGPLANQNVPLFGYLPDSQRYFSYHHTAEDTFDKVNKRELELGAASMAALTYLIDRHGLE